MRTSTVIGLSAAAFLTGRYLYLQDLQKNIAIDFGTKSFKLNKDGFPELVLTLTIFNNTPFKFSVSGVSSNAYLNGNRIGIIHANTTGNQRIKIMPQTRNTVEVNLVFLRTNSLLLLKDFIQGNVQGSPVISFETTIYTGLGRLKFSNQIKL